jgi:hypothetical protein
MVHLSHGQPTCLLSPHFIAFNIRTLRASLATALIRAFLLIHLGPLCQFGKNNMDDQSRHFTPRSSISDLMTPSSYIHDTPLSTKFHRLEAGPHIAALDMSLTPTPAFESLTRYLLATLPRAHIMICLLASSRENVTLTNLLGTVIWDGREVLGQEHVRVQDDGE